MAGHCILYQANGLVLSMGMKKEISGLLSATFNRENRMRKFDGKVRSNLNTAIRRIRLPALRRRKILH